MVDVAPRDEGMVLVGHGSRSPAGQAEFLELARLVAGAASAVVVEPGFLELSDPSVGDAIDRAVARGARRVAIVPAMLTSAGHSKSDVPASVFEACARHPDVSFCYGRPLGVDHALLRLAQQRLAQAGGVGLPLLVVARGTSDPDANSEAWKAGRLLWEWGRPPFFEVAYTGVTGPSVAEALHRGARLGAASVAAFSWFLCTGVLLDRVATELAASDIEVVDAGYFGPDPALVPVILDRYHEALGAAIRMNCDACAYRAPFPGLEERVGQPLGVGHSHLATAHRRHG